MPWKALSPFPISGTNIPFQKLSELRIDKTYIAATQYLKDQDTLLARSQGLSGKITEHLRDLEDRKKWKKVIKALRRNDSLESFKELISNLPSSLESLQRDLENLTHLHDELSLERDKLAIVFEKEFQEKRDLLWKLLSDEEIEDALSSLNPTFYRFVKNYKQSWRSRNRDSQMRKRESTLASYISRFCAKNSVAGNAGPSFPGRFTKKNSSALTWMKDAHKTHGVGQQECFMAFWAAEALASRMFQDEELLFSLPFFVHPVVEFAEDGLIAAIFSAESSYLPSIESFEIEEDARDLLSLLETENTVSGILSHFDSEEMKKKIPAILGKLLHNHFLLNKLYIPAGTEFPLNYLLEVLTEINEYCPAREKWLTALETFSEARPQLASTLGEEHQAILDRLNHDFQELTKMEATRGQGQYYADRFIFYKDVKRACSPLDLSKEVEDRILSEISFGLELYAPEWFELILPAVFASDTFFSKIRTLDAEELDPKENPSLFAQLNHFLTLSESPEYREILKKNERYLSWVTSIGQLKDLRKGLFERIDGKKECVSLDLSDPLLRKYRSKLRDILEKESPRLPIFSSATVLQISAKDLDALNRQEYVLILDSLILGNAMNLTSLGFFLGNREERAEATEQALLRAYGLKNIQLVDFARVSSQTTKFTPWINPGPEIEFPALSWHEKKKRFRPQEVKLDANNIQDFTLLTSAGAKPAKLKYPGHLRISEKLIFNDFQGHCPRITLGKSILQRRNWKLPALLFKREPRKDPDLLSDYLLFLETIKNLGLPNCFFVDPSGEKKNIYIDTRNLFLVEVLWNLSRENKDFRISEFLPDEEHLWLHKPDASDSNHLGLQTGLLLHLYFDQSYVEKI